MENVTLPQIVNKSAAVALFKSKFRDFDTETLKQRHDNFAFDKTIESRTKCHDVLHFLSSDRKTPRLVIYPR